MFGLTLSGYIMIALTVLALFGVGYGKYEHNALVAYKTEVTTIANKQIAENKAKIKEQELINKGIINEYQAKLSAIKSYYGGMHNPSSSSMPTLSDTTSTVNGSPSDQLLACSYTTQQLVSLQDWIKQQAGL
jgi:hypothetical protein